MGDLAAQRTCIKFCCLEKPASETKRFKEPFMTMPQVERKPSNSIRVSKVAKHWLILKVQFVHLEVSLVKMWKKCLK
jgi:hypothetical protein